MSMNPEIKTFKIYYGGRLDYVATYRPVVTAIIRKKASRALDHVDFFFVNSRWPRDGEI